MIATTQSIEGFGREVGKVSRYDASCEESENFEAVWLGAFCAEEARFGRADVGEGNSRWRDTRGGYTGKYIWKEWAYSLIKSLVAFNRFSESPRRA